MPVPARDRTARSVAVAPPTAAHDPAMPPGTRIVADAPESASPVPATDRTARRVAAAPPTAAHDPATDRIARRDAEAPEAAGLFPATGRAALNVALAPDVAAQVAASDLLDPNVWDRIASISSVESARENTTTSSSNPSK